MKAGALVSRRLDSFNSMELYLLVTAILFHDAGIVFGRSDHQKRISEVYNHVWKQSVQDKEEKLLVGLICGAHTGETRDGSYDTLKGLSTSNKLGERGVDPKKIAAVLRFADELAEGPQRTSAFLLSTNRFSDERAVPFHKYASATSVHVDPGNQRIALMYSIGIENNSTDAMSVSWEELPSFLELIQSRITKLDQERRYARHYAPVLSEFRETTFSFHFEYQQSPVDCGPLGGTLNDLVIPGESTVSISDKMPHLKPAAIIDNLRAAIEQEQARDKESV